MKQLLTIAAIALLMTACGEEKKEMEEKETKTTEQEADKTEETEEESKEPSAPKALETKVLDDLLVYDSHAEIVEAFGEESVSTKFISGPEGMGGSENTILFEGTKDEVWISWMNDTTKSDLIAVEIRHPESTWKSKSGVGVGTTLEELEKLNGKPFTFLGFGWDFSGMTAFSEGELAKQGLGASLEASTDDHEMWGDGEYSSDDEAARAAGVQVAWLTLGNID